MRIFKNIILGLFLLILLPVFSFAKDVEVKNKGTILIKVYHMPTCKSCIKVIHDIIPTVAEKYDKKLKWEYIDITNEENYKQFLQLEKVAKRKLGSPTIVIGNKVLVGMTEIADSLEKNIKDELILSSSPMYFEGKGIDLIEYFKSFGPLAVIGAGLVDGFNPCAFTVIVFFVSFLTFMGYSRREMALVGAAYIAAVFFTYLGLGLGLFKVVYSLKGFYLISKIIYLVIGALSIFLGILAIKDYFIFKQTGKTDDMSLQLPQAVKNKIHSIVGKYYRKDKDSVQKKTLLGLLLSALTVGVMISLLEAVCTGQLYLPTIIFVLKEGQLRTRALFYLIIYNIMFILPLIMVLLFALFGTSSKQFEEYAKKHFGIVKLVMAAVFLALGVVLWLGV